MKKIFLFIFLLSNLNSFSQTIQVLTSGTKTSLRGLSVVNDSVVWASGSSGKIARSLDGGATFTWLTVAGYEQRDFRDIEAFDANTSIIMAVAEPAVILRTTNGGKLWQTVFEDSTKGMFLDAMNFAGNNGIVVGDPINDRMFVATTTDKGGSWHVVSKTTVLDSGEAFFASSGTNVALLPSRKRGVFTYLTATGGTTSHFIKDGVKTKLHLLHGKTSQGANSVSFHNNHIVVVGGDFANDKDTIGNCLLSFDGGKSWHKPTTSPHGYRSCVTFITPDKLIACGTSGVDVSTDGGENWSLISTESFHVCQKAKDGKAIFLAGKDGKIARLNE